MQTVPVIEQEFLPLRAKLLEIAAALDRLDRARRWRQREPRVTKIRAAIEALLRRRRAIGRSRFSWFSAGRMKTIGGRNFE